MANKKKKKDGPSLGPSLAKEGIPCICSKCKTPLGNFLSCGDNGDVIVVCTKCKSHRMVSNAQLLEIEEDPEDYNIPVQCEKY